MSLPNKANAGTNTLTRTLYTNAYYRSVRRMWLSFIYLKTYKMKTYTFYIINMDSKKQRILKVQSESLSSAETEVLWQMYHNEYISGFAY